MQAICQKGGKHGDVRAQDVALLRIKNLQIPEFNLKTEFSGKALKSFSLDGEIFCYL